MATVGVNGDRAGGAVAATADASIDGVPIIVVGDAVASHPPCPQQPAHCSASMQPGADASIDGIRICVTGSPASCGHALAGTAAADIS